MKSQERLATCGACGCERPVDGYMLRHPRTMQFQRRPKERTDVFYCGCQSDPDDMPCPWE